MTTSTSINIKDIGPVTEFAYELASPGLHVLRGKQGAGKTTILRTVQLAVDGRTDIQPEKRDGSPRGQAEVAGRLLRIARQTRQEGELAVEGLGDLDITTLHSPKFQTERTRDQHRIRTLARLAGVAADRTLFYRLFPPSGDDGGAGAFESIVGKVETTDLLELADQVKRAMHEAARRSEQQADAAAANITTQAAVFAGVDLDQPDNERALSDAHQAAIQNAVRLTERRRTAREAIETAEKAQEQLERLPTVSVAEAQERLTTAQSDEEAMTLEVADLERQLSEAKARLQGARERRDSASRALEDARRLAAMGEKWREQIEAAKRIDCPTQHQIDEAQSAVQAALAAVETGRKVRAAKAAKAQAEAFEQSRKRFDSAAKAMRDSAAEIGDVLAEAIGGLADCPLRVKIDDDGYPRLVVETDRADDEYFDELSDGERWLICLRIASARNRLIVLPQAAYGELAPSTRRLIHETAKAQGCYVLTAQADDGELRGEVYGD